jgi:hypothetical protein
LLCFLLTLRALSLQIWGVSTDIALGESIESTRTESQYQDVYVYRAPACASVNKFETKNIVVSH